MWGKRTHTTALKMMSRQLAVSKRPSGPAAKPTGYCIHELLTRIQNEDSEVPTATSTAAAR